MSISDVKKKQNTPFSEQESTKSEDLYSYIAFELAEENFAVKIEDVREVTHTPPISQMPKTPDFFEGVANIRGDIVTILNLEKKLKLTNKINLGQLKDKPKYTIVLDMKDYNIGFSVEKVPQTLILSKSEIEAVEELSKITRVNYNFLEGLGRKNNNLYMILNIKKVFSSSDYKKINHLSKEAKNEEKEKNTSSR